MVRIVVDGKLKKCAFCKHWYDVTNQYINPVSPRTGLWEYEPNAMCMCKRKNLKMKAFASCNEFASKI